MEYRDHHHFFFVERANGNYRQALEHISECIRLCPDTDLLPKLSHYRKDTLRRIPKERKERSKGEKRNWVPAFLRKREEQVAA